MKFISMHILFLMLCTASVFGGNGDDSTGKSFSESAKRIAEERKSTALLYSIILPGSGQTMLGSPYKGFGFTLVGFGSALTTLISHNNFVASNERLDALEFQYRNSTTWEASNQIYKSLNETYTKMKSYQKMRNTFALVSAVVWTFNIVDVMFLTEDEGESVFSMLRMEQTAVAIAGNIDHQQQLQLRIPLQ